MVLPSWFTLVKWLGFAAVTLALVGTPVVYMNRKVTQAFDMGYVAGQVEIQRQIQAQRLETERQMEEANQRAVEEAQERARDNENFNRTVRFLRSKLAKAQAERPAPPTCVYDPVTTSVWRDAAKGHFGSSASEAEASPGGPAG